jgi:hypothetical protein
MPKNTQEYLNGLINKPRMFYLDLSQQVTTENCSHCNQKTRNKATPSLSGEIEDLSEFKRFKCF